MGTWSEATIGWERSDGRVCGAKRPLGGWERSDRRVWGIVFRVKGMWSEATIGLVGAERPSGTWSGAIIGWEGADRLLGTYVERSERSDRRVWGIVCDTPKVPRGSLIRVKPNLAVVHLCAALSLSFVSGTITSINTLLCCREYVRSVEYERIISEEEGRSPAPRQEQEGASGVLVAVTTATGVVRRRGDGRRSTVDGRRSTIDAAWSRI